MCDQPRPQHQIAKMPRCAFRTSDACLFREFRISALGKRTLSSLTGRACLQFFVSANLVRFASFSQGKQSKHQKKYRSRGGTRQNLVSRDEKAVAIDACSLDERRMFSICSTDAFTQTDLHHESAAVDIDAIEFLTIYPWQVCDKCGSRLPHAIQKHEDMIGDIIQHCGCCSQNMKNNGCTARKELYPDSIQISSQADAETLRIITMEFQWQHVRGGQASVTSRQKKTVARAIWKIIFASTHEVFFAWFSAWGIMFHD